MNHLKLRDTVEGPKELVMAIERMLANMALYKALTGDPVAELPVGGVPEVELASLNVRTRIVLRLARLQATGYDDEPYNNPNRY